MDHISVDEASLLKLPLEIWAEILTYLPYSDVKQSRLVCQHIADAANIGGFAERSKLIITAKNLKVVKKYLNKNGNNDSYMQFRHVELYSQRSSRAMICVLDNIGVHVRTLVLHQSPIVRILHGRLPNLRCLSLGRCAHYRWRSHGVDLNNFPRLKSLDIVQESSNTARNRMLGQLTCGLTVPQLEHLEVRLTNEQEDGLMRVLVTHADTLKDVYIYVDDFPAQSLKSWSEVWQRLKQLRSIKLEGCFDHKWLENIFSSLPEQNVMQCINLSGILPVKDALLRLITCKWSTTLRQLNLAKCTLLTECGIRCLAKLRENLLDLDVSYCHSIRMPGLLKGIAKTPNTVLQRLNLSDMLHLDEYTFGELASRLPNLRVLEVVCCPKALTNRSLAKVFHYMTELQRLVLDDCKFVSNKGLIGTEWDPWPISRLVGLQWLSLRSCRKISDRSLLYALKFPDLRYLNLGYCCKITDKGIGKLVENCPTIVDLSLNSCIGLSDRAVLGIAQGLKRLEKLNISYCNRLTDESLSFMTKYSTSLRQLKAYGLDGSTSSEEF